MESRKALTFGDSPYLMRSLRFAAIDEHGDELWLIVCDSCMGNGYDLESDPDLIEVCPSCEGAGEFGPFTEFEARQELHS
jgi:hypothetical protein